MKRILVGVDGSKESRDAAKLAEEIARATGSQLVIACAVAPVISTQGAPGLLAQAEQWQRNEREHANAVVKEIASSIGPGVVVETLVSDGSAAVALSELARAGDVEMVVVGHRGRNAVARALLGSVADRLVQISPKPVLVVR
jgi:nucleotide-binding universal stress UspA family protein